MSSECDESRLQLLLHGEEDSDQFRTAAKHVESCETCRRRLTNLAGDPGSWSDVRELLGPPDAYPLPTLSEDSESAPMCQRSVADPDASLSDLDFLGSPSHPEMLGRLGRYEIERVIGTGGMGVVLKGFDTELNRPVAIKVLAPHLAHSGAARQRFAREGRAAAAVVHEHVVAIHNVETEGELPFLVMQYVAGESLQARVERQGPLGTSEILRIGIQAAAGLAAAHEQGLVHRDIKPANLLLLAGVERALLTDFGLARAIDDASLTRTGVVAGTPHYMSPEQADGRTVDHRSDLFSLGSVLYFMATGHPPFRAERPMAVLNRICHESHRPVREINSEIPEQLASIIDRLLDKKPSRRPGSAAEVQRTLASLLSDVQQGRLRRPKTRRRLTRTKKTFASLAAIVVTVGVVFWIRVWLDHPEVTPRTIRTGPSAPVYRDDEYSGDTVTRILSFGPASEAEYAAEAAAVELELRRLDRQTPVGDPYMQRTSSEWRSEIDAAERRLEHLENLPYPDFLPQGDRQ